MQWCTKIDKYQVWQWGAIYIRLITFDEYLMLDVHVFHSICCVNLVLFALLVETLRKSSLLLFLNLRKLLLWPGRLRPLIKRDFFSRPANFFCRFSWSAPSLHGFGKGMYVPLIYLHVSTKICVNLGKLFNKVLSQAASFSLCTLWTNKGKGRLQMLSLFVFLPESIWKLFDPRFSFTQPIKARSREEMQVTPPHRS